MATGSMSWQFHNQKHIPSYGLPGNSDGSAGDMQDMHLKMSKKIAQLTKVIYALNTKNDEHEAAMCALKDAHEEELQQMLTETTVKIQRYQLKIGDELDLRKKIRNLEECIVAYEREKKQVLSEIEAHQRMNAEREINLERNHEEKIMLMTRELLESKAAFEQRINDYDLIISNVEREKGKNMDSVIENYRGQVQSLKSQLDTMVRDTTVQREKLIDSHSLQVQNMENEISNMKEEVKKSTEDSEAKLEKMKSFYEHELKVLRSTSMSDEDLAAKWLERETALKQDWSKVENNLRKKVKDLSNELDVQHEQVSHLLEQLNQSKAEASGTLDHVKDMRSHLSKLQQDLTSSEERVKSLENDLSTSNAKAESQANDILRKSSIIGTLEAIKLTQEESIRDLESQMKDLKRRYDHLETERSALQSSQSDENANLMQQLQSLSKRIDTLTDEKSALQKQFKRDLEEMKVSHEDELETLKKQFEKEADSMARSHEAEVVMMKSEAKDAMNKLLQEMEERILSETTKFEEDKAAAVTRVEDERNIVERNLQSAQTEIARLNSSIEKHESGLGDASIHITSLRSRISELEDELKSSEARTRSTEVTVAELRNELKQQSESHQNAISTLSRKHEEALENNKRTNDERWEDILRLKFSDFQTRLTSQFNDDRQRALSDLERRKDEEVVAMKSGWEEQIRQLSTQMSDMRQSFEMEKRDLERKVESDKADMTEAERKLRNEAQQAADEYSSKIDHLIEAHNLALLALEQRHSEEVKSLESRMDSHLREELHSQMRAHQISVEALKEQMKVEKLNEFENREREFEQDMDDLKSELTHQHASSLDDVTRQYETQLSSLKFEVTSSHETRQRNEENFQQKLRDLETDLRFSSAELNKLRDKVTEQNESLSSLNKELDQKGQDMLRVRSEANIELRRREEELMRKYRSHQDKYEAESIRQKQAIVHEFNRATEALKDKISSLNIALHESEERYLMRESRPEDLAVIEELKGMVREKESQMQKLLDDKKFYQMELVNRETNFNKVFSASPNVGVLNPINKKKKGINNTSAPARFSSHFVSVPNLSSIEPAINGSNRLDPLPAGTNSPINYNKHLQPTPPPHPKKFLR